MERTLYDSEHTDLGESFRAFLTRNAAGHYEQWERDGIVPREFFSRAGRDGFLAFEVEDIDEALTELRGRGVPMLDPAPRPGAGGTTIAFLDPGATGSVLVELVWDPSGPGASHGPSPA